MERTTAAIGKKTLRKTRKSTSLILNKTTVLLSAASFLGARCEISPLGSLPALALSAAMLPNTASFLPSFLFVILGLLSKGYYSQLRTDLLICALLAVLHFTLRRKNLSGTLCALTGGAVCILGKILFPQIFQKK